MSQRHTDVSLQAEDADQRDLRANWGEACSLQEVLDRVSGKWSIGIVVEAAKRPIRFTELERTINGISRRMLTLTLRQLERDGLLTRTVYPTVPPKVEYEVTPMGRELYEVLLPLTSWAERHRATIATARHEYDAAHAPVEGPVAPVSSS
jgi:DNA-binding HxlR family transcriptional regulator